MGEFHDRRERERAAKRAKPKYPPVHVVDLGIDCTNEDILDQMRHMKRSREERIYGHVVCTIRGFNSDRRELWEIPEVRAFCRRLVNLAFISYLDTSTMSPLLCKPSLMEEARGMFGALEVWLTAEGLMAMEVKGSRELLERFHAAVKESNDKADAAVGPMVEK